MSVQWRIYLAALVFLLVYDFTEARRDDNFGWKGRRMISYPRDWDTDWRRVSRSRGWRLGDSVPQYDYQADGPTPAPVLRPRVEVVSTGRHETSSGGVWVTRQRGSAVIPNAGATVRVSPRKVSSINQAHQRKPSTLQGRRKGKKRKGQRNLRHKHNGPHEYSQDQPSAAPPSERHCARCPSDRAVLAKKGSSSVLMETPPVIPCHPWSSINKVKSEVLAGPQPGAPVPEGSHKIVIRLFRRRRTLATCVTRYNVIVRKCPELELGREVKAECSQGQAWGSHCNLSCPVGYLLEGSSSTECTDDLEWSGDMPQCIPSTSCPSPVTPEHGHLSCRTPQHQPVSPKAVSLLPDGTVCHFQCYPGYMVPPTQANLTRIRCIAGSWDSDQDPTCVETNEVEEEELPPDVTAEEAFKFDGKDCPPQFCRNGGMCLMILDEPMCSCQAGYSGTHCEERYMDPEEDANVSSDIEETNAIT